MKRKAFTIIELLVVISIIALLIGILLPAISKARESAKLTESLTNLKNLGAAHQNYAAQWNDRQFTIAADNLGVYGSVAAYNTQVGEHPGIALGWGSGADEGFWGYWMDWPGNQNLVYAIYPGDGFGWFRIPNCKYFSEYVNGRFYDKTFYAPKDKIVLEAIGETFDNPGEWSFPQGATGSTPPYWSSYVLSPAALFAPKVMDSDGFTDPFDVGGGFKCPSMSQARHSDLKSHMLEHHWLQGNRNIGCNPAFTGGTYENCEPYYFNHGYESAPATLFYDGSVRVLGLREAGDGDNQARVGGGLGLYFRPSKDPDEMQGMQQLQTDGYFLGAAYDFSANANFYETGFHILTKDGILGRDTLGTP
jgi:prepilin-type N-terminal cleavage/methylation domain-containing protein